MKTMVGVLRGGPSQEYDISIKSGCTILENLDRELHQPIDIFIDRGGKWHRNGIQMDQHKSLAGVDVAFNVLHGEYGENGSLQQLMSSIGIKYTGADQLASSISFNKNLTKESLSDTEIKIPRSITVSRDEEIEPRSFQIFRTFSMPTIIKPITGGSSINVTFARSLEELNDGIKLALTSAPHAIVEEYIRGREASVGIIDEFRGEKIYALPPIEIVPQKSSSFFDYNAKYSGESYENCPGNFSREEKDGLINAAKIAHEKLQTSHYSRSDFIIHQKRGIYFLEINPASAVGLTKDSLMPKSLNAVGVSMKDFLTHIVNLAKN